MFSLPLTTPEDVRSDGSSCLASNYQAAIKIVAPCKAHAHLHIEQSDHKSKSSQNCFIISVTMLCLVGFNESYEIPRHRWREDLEHIGTEHADSFGP